MILRFQVICLICIFQKVIKKLIVVYVICIIQMNDVYLISLSISLSFVYLLIFIFFIVRIFILNHYKKILSLS